MATTPANRPDSPLAALVHAGGMRAGEEIPIHSPVVRIGQGAQNDVTIDDDTVSTQHARLEYEAGEWRLTDLDSRNGTYIDGVRLAPNSPTPVPDGALIGFGLVKLNFRPAEGVDLESARASYRPEPARPPLAERSTFRLPLWVVLVLILLVVVIIGLFVWFGGDPTMVEPSLEGVAQRLAAPVTGLDT